MCWSKGHVWITISVGSLSHGDWSLCFNHGRLLTARPCCPEMEGPTGPTFWACRVAGNGPGYQVGESGVLSSRLSLWCWDCSSLCVCLVYSEEQRVLDFAEVHSIDFFFCFDCYRGLCVWFQEEDLTTWPPFTSPDTLLRERWSP